jgi:hypothetical protein
VDGPSGGRYREGQKRYGEDAGVFHREGEGEGGLGNEREIRRVEPNKNVRGVTTVWQRKNRALCPS